MFSSLPQQADIPFSPPSPGFHRSAHSKPTTNRKHCFRPYRKIKLCDYNRVKWTHTTMHQNAWKTFFFINCQEDKRKREGNLKRVPRSVTHQEFYLFWSSIAHTFIRIDFLSSYVWRQAFICLANLANNDLNQAHVGAGSSVELAITVCKHCRSARCARRSCASCCCLRNQHCYMWQKTVWSAAGSGGIAMSIRLLHGRLCP